MPKPVIQTHRIQVVTPVFKSIPLTTEAKKWFNPRIPITSPLQVIDLLARQACNVREHFWVFHLDIGSRLIAVELIGIGSLVDMEITPAECVRSALLTGACSIILVHCHPSGNPEPSDHDITATKHLVQAAELMGLLVEDHIIIAKGGFFSFREEKLL